MKLIVTICICALALLHQGCTSPKVKGERSAVEVYLAETGTAIHEYRRIYEVSVESLRAQEAPSYRWKKRFTEIVREESAQFQGHECDTLLARLARIDRATDALHAAHMAGLDELGSYYEEGDTVLYVHHWMPNDVEEYWAIVGSGRV